MAFSADITGTLSRKKVCTGRLTTPFRFWKNWRSDSVVTAVTSGVLFSRVIL